MRIKRMLWWIVIGVIIVAGVQWWVLWAQKRLSFWPDPTRQGLAGTEAFGITELTISASDGRKLVSWWRPPDANRATVLFFPGNAGSVADRRIFLEALATSGYGILALNYRGYGGSEGSPSEKGVYTDGLSAYDFLVDEMSVPAGTVVLFGQSLGGTVATHVAVNRRPAGLVLESAFTSAQSMARRVVPYLPLWLLMTYRFDNVGRIGRITCPKLIVHGRHDETVPFSHAQRLYAAAAEPKRLFPIAVASHNDVLEARGVEYLEFLQEFIDSCVADSIQ